MENEREKKCKKRKKGKKKHQWYEFKPMPGEFMPRAVDTKPPWQNYKKVGLSNLVLSYFS